MKAFHLRYQTEIQSAIRRADELELVEPTGDAELDEKLRQAQEEWADEQVLDAIFGEPADKQVPSVFHSDCRCNPEACAFGVSAFKRHTPLSGGGESRGTVASLAVASWMMWSTQNLFTVAIGKDMELRLFWRGDVPLRPKGSARLHGQPFIRAPRSCATC